jgi:NAD(P)-dependent dehydrogenase (short-subunit alcohol dehydrogenase family)
VGSNPLTALFGLDGKVALVTGARSGIGRALSRTLVEAGAGVALSSRDVAALDEVTRELRSLGAEPLPLALDVTDAGDVERALDAVIGRFGRLDVLVNNAGVAIRGEALSYAEGDWRAVVDTNLTGTFLVSRAAAARLREGGGGRIVTLSSTFARTAMAGRAAYAASKAGVEQLTRVLAVEWAEHGITVNAIAPTTVLTESRAALFSDPAARAARLAHIPLGRFGTPEDLSGALLLLAADAGRFITGQTLLVDGGFTLL